MKKINYLKCVPNDWCEIINFQVGVCRGCNNNSEIATSKHLEEVHGIRMKNLMRIWQEDICPITQSGKNKKREDLKIQLKQSLALHSKQIMDAKEKLMTNNS